MEDKKRYWLSEVFTKLQISANVSAIKHGKSANKKTNSLRRKMKKISSSKS